MADAKSEVSKLMQAHKGQIDELHRKLAEMQGVNKERLSVAVEKLKSAHVQFEDDAQDFITH